MDSTYSDVQQDVSTYSGGHYTAQAIAKTYNVSDSTVRNRWFPWIAKVAPEPLLKDGKSYTELARSLFAEFAQVPKPQRQEWVEEAKARYAQEWASVGVIDGELMPESVGGALAQLESHNAGLQAVIEAELADLDIFIGQVNAAEADFSEAERRTFQTVGVRRGIQRFKLETQAELETLNALRQQQMSGDAGR